ncbi:MAG: hypothetical protein QNK05_22265, partial [Myxococcota bacterium]|nr:hypothetical protein [Myxococcota bacterium]
MDHTIAREARGRVGEPHPQAASVHETYLGFQHVERVVRELVEDVERPAPGTAALEDVAPHCSGADAW